MSDYSNSTYASDFSDEEFNVGSGKKCPGCGGTVAAGRKTCHNCGRSFASLGERVDGIEDAIVALGVATFGDVSGHDFHGNQWTVGTSVVANDGSDGGNRGKVVNATHDEDGNKIKAGHVAIQFENGQGTWGMPTEKVARQLTDAQYRSNAKTVGTFLNRGRGDATKAYAAGRALLGHHGDTAPVKTATNLRSRLDAAGIVL